MDFAIPQRVAKELEQFEGFLRTHLEPQLAAWYKKESGPFEYPATRGRIRFSMLNNNVICVYLKKSASC